MTSVSIDSVSGFELMYETGWTDGLPVVPPTKERVKEFTDYLKRAPDELIAEIPPLGGKATVERIAVNAVMAGCLPEHMPVVMTAIQAMMDERFRGLKLGHVECDEIWTFCLKKQARLTMEERQTRATLETSTSGPPWTKAPA